MSSRFVLAITLTIAAIALVSAFYWYKNVRSAPFAQEYASVEVMNSSTARDNAFFNAALEHERVGDYARAISELTNALQTTTKEFQRVTVQFHLARDLQFVGDYAEAVQILRQIAATPSYPAISRAVAMESIGRIYANGADKATRAAIFEHPPYADMLVSTSTNLTTRRLFRAAAAVYPLPISLYDISGTYERSAEFQKAQGATPDQISVLTDKMNEAFSEGERALADVRGHPPYPTYIADALAVRAIALARMERLGPTPFGDPELAFSEALDSYQSPSLVQSSYMMQDGSLRLWYAFYLMWKHGADRAADIRSIIAPIHQDPTNRGLTMKAYMKSFIGAPRSATKSDLVTLAGIDPEFKMFLVSLGWTEKDFTQG